ncbi:DoxX family protein [Tianweitania sediminis]|uniref:DoxX family protein n=1 Tax=Tianweitania sediminis TaxID=1502156 RepID=A0A8J7R687_9HYPH|nr:DoxX family protein [Tianweitania sediminis]MBP0438612.1 DoxX family protein [Tianweitania sediminis]
MSTIVLIGRVLLSIIFILSGFGKLTALGGTAGYFASLGIPAPMVAAVVVGLVELVGGLAVLLGFRTREGAWALAIFCVASAVVAHSDWSDMMQMIAFQKNLALAGGLLVLAAFGPGPISIEARRA